MMHAGGAWFLPCSYNPVGLFQTITNDMHDPRALESPARPALMWFAATGLPLCRFEET